MYRVLHLEKSDFFKKIVKNILIEKGFCYYPADNTAEAFEVLEQNQIDLIITSCLIEGENVEEFIKDINKGEYKDIPIFVVTSNEIEEDKKRLLNLGISDYITKENLVEELLKQIEVIFKEDELIKFLKSISIAIIDDSNFETHIMKDILEANNITNVTCYDSGEAVLKSEIKYDMYLVDMVLENEFGKNVVMKIRRNNINASIIVVSSLTNTKTIASILRSGADDYIRKPLDKDIFIAKLKSNMRSHVVINKLEGDLKALEEKIDVLENLK